VSSWRTRPTAALLAVSFVLVGVYFLLPNGTPQSILYDSIGVASALVIALATAVNRPEPWQPWLLFAAGNLFFAVADIIFNVIVNPPVPSVADVFYLGG
jgi:two-component system, cell cycle response regulator